MKLLLFALVCCISAARLEVSEVMELSGHVDGEISIPCFASWAGGINSEHNRMLFCQDVCSGESILLQTKMKRSTVIQQGRYIMQIDKRERAFNVSIKSLKRADTGRYLCQIERSFGGLHQEVNLKVLDDATVPPELHPSINTTLQTEEDTAARWGNFSFGPSPALPTLSPREKENTQPEATNLTDTTIVIIVSGSLAFLVCAIIPLIFCRHWRSTEDRHRQAVNKVEGEENADFEPSTVAMGLHAVEQEAPPEPSPNSNLQYAAIYEGLDPKPLTED